MSNFIHHEGARVPIKTWTHGVPVEDSAMQQLRNLSGLPFVHKHIAAMPDVHWGMGATVGSVIATRGAIVPAAVGVDIGCGMMAVRTALTSHDLPDSLAALRAEIERTVPHGRTANGGPGDRGAWHNVPDRAATRLAPLADEYARIVDRHPKAANPNGARHMGTLGTGNHFIEVCLDEADRVWVMLHSGSRGVGNRIGTYFIERAKKDMERWFIQLPDADLAYLPQGSELYGDYIAAVHWAQAYALANRETMMEAALGALASTLGRDDVAPTETAVNCHHNYVAMEHQFGEKVWITRKGAVRAQEGDLGIIPGSMGVRSYIVRGRGNPDSFCSCSHGAGRKMSRGAAVKTISLADHAAATEGVECRKDAGVLDESPAAYKDIDAVMAAQTDLVEVVHTLKQVVCVKG